LQGTRIVVCSHKKDPEVSLEIRWKDVKQVQQDDKGKARRVTLVTRKRPFIFELENDEELKSWTNDIKNCWKKAVSAVTETPVEGGHEKVTVRIAWSCSSA
jgi:hypothetical protein